MMTRRKKKSKKQEKNYFKDYFYQWFKVYFSVVQSSTTLVLLQEKLKTYIWRNNI